MIKLLRHYKPYTGLVLLTVVMIGLQSFSELFLPTVMQQIIDVSIVNKDYTGVWIRAGVMLAVVILQFLDIVGIGYFSAKIGSGVSRDLRAKLFTKVQGFSLREFDEFGTSSLITRTTNDITQIQNFTVMLLRIVVMAPIMCIGGLVMAFWTNASLAGYVLIAMPVVVIVIGLIASKAMPMFKAMQKKIDRLNQITRENLTGMRVVKAFIKTDYEIKRFDQANDDLTKTSIRVQRIMGSMMPALMLVMNLVSVMLTWVGAERILEGGLEVGQLVAFIQYVMMIMFSLTMLSMVFVMLPRAIVSANRVNEVLDTEDTLRDGVKPSDAPDKKGYVEFRNVSFRYPGADEPVLKNISFSASPGQTTAFIGSTGSGKSTVVNMIPRLYDVSEGQVLVDGVDVRNFTQKELRDKIGFVPQKGVLFSGTIAENLRFGKEDATEEELWHAASTAQAKDFIKQKPLEMNEHIAQGGSNVSGGQKQRLSIARALVKKPEVYIFDDSFSALDFKTDATLRAALKKETQSATVLIVAQRVSTIMDADRIVVLDNGEVCGIGTHRELLSSCDVYREIVESQLSKEEIA